jgi:hypothetical protein
MAPDLYMLSAMQVYRGLTLDPTIGDAETQFSLTVLRTISTGVTEVLDKVATLPGVKDVAPPVPQDGIEGWWQWLFSFIR